MDRHSISEDCMWTKPCMAGAALLLLGITVEANVAKYAGRYQTVAVYTYGTQAGKAGYGVATASRTGDVIRTLYWPHVRRNFSGTGRIDARGWFKFNDRLEGRLKIFNYRTGFGRFRDNTTGGGFFGVWR